MIKIGLGKALGFSLLTFIGLNFLFIIIAATFSVSGLEPLFTAISSDPLIIITILFAPINYMPGNVIMSLYAQISFGPIDASLIRSVGFLVSPFVAALVAGLTGESKGGSFGGWMITALIGSAAWGVLAFVYLDPNPIVLLIGYLIIGAVYGVFFGCFALLFTKTEMY